MRGKQFIFPIVFSALAATVRADENFPVLQAGGETFSNVTITSVSATDIYFTYTGGMENVKIKTLSPALQKHFGFDLKKAQVRELEMAENKVRYHAQLLEQPAAHPPDMARDPHAANTPASSPLWRTDFPAALKQAQADNKLVLIDFTGSDWCPWCIKFDREVLATDRFAGYAQKNLVLVKADFPRHTPQRVELIHSNAALKNTFNVDSFPTYILLKSNGEVLGRQVGYLDGGPEGFIRELDGFNHR